MNLRTRMPALAGLATALITGTGLALTVLPATAATTTHQAAAKAAPAPTHGRTPLSRSRLGQVRDRQRAIATQHRAAPTLTKAGTKTFTVNSTADTPLANLADTHCVTATGRCSLRAAVQAADNLSVPVKIVLGKHTYTLTSATYLLVTNPKGVSIVGLGAGKTVIAGAGSDLFYLDAAATGRPAAKLWLTSLKLTNGTSTDGGAIYMNDGTSGATLVLDHVAATHNTATSYGGVIEESDYGLVYINHSSFSHNHAPYGGVLYQYWGDVNITGSTFTHNGSPTGVYGEGGAFYNEYGVFTMTGGSISDNAVSDATQGGEGGAIYNAYAMETLNNVHVNGNVAGSLGNQDGYGGAQFAYEDVLEVNGGTMSGNKAFGPAGSGGALYEEEQNQISLHGLTMTGNLAGGSSDGDGGGAIFVYGAYYPSQLVIDHGSSITGSNHAAVYLYSFDGGIDASILNSTLSHNSDLSDNGWNGLGCGGAVCAYSSTNDGINLEMANDKVVGNASVGDSAAGAVTGEAISNGQLSVVLRHNTFTNNHSGAGGYGGAVGIWTDDDDNVASLRMTSNTFTGNRAGSQSDGGWGGALSAYYDTSITDNGSTFSHNHAVGNSAYGGAVYDYGYYGSASWTRTTFVGNTAGVNHTGNSGYGGAYYSNSYGGDVFNQVTMSGNKSASYGGGYYGDSDTYMALFRASTISGNLAGTSTVAGVGGGIYSSDAVLTVQNSTISGNHATSVGTTKGQGGGIWHSGSRMGLRYSTVSGNVAKDGGGIYSDAYGGSLLSSIVSANHTQVGGAENDCAVAVAVSRLNSLGGNVLGQGGCVTALASGDKVSKHPGLKPLANNGGPTKTMALSKKSPAVGRAAFQVPAVDQRGHKRPGSHADAGAFEL